MTKEEIQKILKEEMDFPDWRVDQFNLPYIFRNIGIRNGEHPKYREVIDSLKVIQRKPQGRNSVWLRVQFL